MKRNIHGILETLAAVAALSACVSCAEVEDGLPGDAETRATFTPGGITDLVPAADAPFTPASELQTKKNPFTEGDQMGFFSDGGDTRDDKKGEEGFSNFKLTYDGTTFTSEDFERDLGTLGHYFGYYPYMDSIESEKGVSVYAEDTVTRVTDFLTINYAGSGKEMLFNGQSGHFFHTFAGVRVKCGKGFENFDKENGKVFLQLKRKVSAVRIDWPGRSNHEAAFTAVKLVYDDTARTKEQRRLPTFLTTDGGEAAWDAIVPCLPMMWLHAEEPDSGGVTIDAIVLKPGDGSPEIEIPVDNREVFQGVLSGNSHTKTYGVRGNFFYTVVVQKVGTDISVFPYNVEKWNEKDISDTLTTGINGPGDYVGFVKACNNIFKGGESYSEEEIRKKVEESEDLRKYGTEVNDTFTVFLCGDLDLSGTADEENVARVTNLVVPLDGRGYTITGIRGGGGLCGTLHTTLKNLTLKNIHVVQPEGSTGAIGLLADSMANDAKIENCSVENGWLQGNGKVGAAVGTMTGGSIHGCSFGGIMIGETDPSHKGLVGTYMSGDVGEDNRNDMKTTTESE